MSEYSAEEVADHDNKESCWYIVNDCVYDVTNFIREVGANG